MQLHSTIALISVHSDPASETDGQNVYVRQIGEALSRLGWRVDMFTRRTSLSQAEIVQHNSRCRTIRLKAGKAEYVHRQKLIGYLPEFLAKLRQFQQENKIQYRLIHTNYWLSAWVGMELKKSQPLKHVHTYHSLGAVKYAFEQDIPNIGKTRLAIEKVCLETANLSIATCPQQRDYLREMVSKQGSVEIVPCGTNPDLYGSIPRAAAREKLEIASDTFNVLHVGKFNRISGIETLLKAISKPQLHSVANIRLTLVNNSHSSNPLPKARIKQLVWDLGIDNITTIVESASREELATYYAAADVCVVPSHYNPSGMVAVEAMASGTPVIASNLGGLKYVVQHEETGLLFPSQNAFLLSRAIYRLATKPQKRSQLAKAAQARVEELFTWENIASQLSEFYCEQIEQQNIELLQKSLNYSLYKVSA